MKEITTIYLTKEQYLAELDFFISYFKNIKRKSVDVLFGFAWGNEYGDWETIKIKPAHIKKTIYDAEIKTDGEFYQDDLFIKDPVLKISILFCHEEDIHLDYETNNDLTLKTIERWNKLNILRIN